MAKQIVNKDSIIIPVGTMEDFKRPNHPDFMTSSELKAIKFSGMRGNSITDSIELWTLGDMRVSISKTQVELDPLAVNKAYCELFCLDEVAPDTVEMREFNKMIGKNG